MPIITQVLPPADVLEFCLEGSNKIVIKPSGTEPKMKTYAFAAGADSETADELLTRQINVAFRLLSNGA